MALNFHSYFSIHNTSDATAAATEYNPFDEDNHSSHTYTSISSPDITYVSSTGRVIFGATGVYLIVFDVPATVSAATSVGIKIKVNGTAIYTSEDVYGQQNNDPRSYTCHTVISVNVGDYLEVTLLTSDADTVIAENGTSLILFKSNGDYGSLLYTADASAAGSGPAEFTLYDSDNGGTVQSTLNNVTFATATGLLTPDNTRKFLMLSTLIAEVGTGGEVTHKLYANGSSIDDLPGTIGTSSDPVEMSYGFLKSLTASQTASSRVIGAGTITAQKGSAFTIFDITNNGTDPSALLSLTVNADSDDLADGDDICFDSNKWGSYAKTDRVTASGITYTADGGTFVVNQPGKYFILWTLVLGTADTGARTLTIKNGTTAIYTAPWYIHTNTDPMEKTVCLIISADSGDSFTFVITDGEGKVDAGTAITMFRVDNISELTIESSAERQVANDHVINTFKSGVNGVQHESTTDKVMPFSLGVKGPRHLRGRTTAYAPTLGGKEKK